ncbi:MAG: hypothetical protein JKY43_11595 [Phycisphaerales bacterium]|nr:hypothetical protein [Phycisphaerales bacterium]
MFVKIIDSKGKERFINAVYVRSVNPKGDDKAELEIGSMGTKIRVNQSAESIAEVLNMAMPNSIDAILAAEEDSTQANQAAVAIAVIG